MLKKFYFFSLPQQILIAESPRLADQRGCLSDP